MITETISELYKILMDYDIKRYQKPISIHWLYQLTTAKQYLNQKDLHLQFSEWFIYQLETTSNVPEDYLKKKWKIFCDFLQNEKLNIEIQVMVCFGEWFYVFLIDKDNTIQGDDGINSLPSEMPDKVEQWINELQNAAKYPSDIFIEELLLAHEIFY